MTSQTKPSLTLSESVDSTKSHSPHWPKTLVCQSQVHIQMAESDHQNRPPRSKVSLKLKRLALFRL